MICAGDDGFPFNYGGSIGWGSVDPNNLGGVEDVLVLAGDGLYDSVKTGLDRIGLCAARCFPTLSCPSELSLVAPLNASSLSYDVTSVCSTDNVKNFTCSQDLFQLVANASTSYQVTCQAVSYCQHSVNATINVTFLDNTAPVMHNVKNYSFVLDGISQFHTIASYNITTADNSGLASLACQPAAPASFGPGYTAVECNASDSSGNIASVQFQVNVNGNCSTCMKKLVIT